MRYEPEKFYLRSAEEMKARFADTPEAVENTLEIAEKCNWEIEFGKLHYPVFHPPEHSTREGYLRQWLAEGLFRRYTTHAKAEGKEFVVEGIDDPTRLPTYHSSVADDVRKSRFKFERNVRASSRRLLQYQRTRHRRRHQNRHGPAENRAHGH